MAPSPSQRHHHASERSGNKKETNRSLEHEFSAAMVSGASFTFPAQAPPLQPHAMMDTQKKRDAEEEEDEEDPSLTALLGPITALPHLFPATPSPAVTAALTPSRSGARRRLRGDGVETKTHGDLWPAPFCFTGARLGKWRHMPADDAEAAAARLQRGGKITCFLSVEEDNAEITVAEKKNVNKKCAQTQARKRLRGDETPTGAGRDAPPHCSLTFTSTHWWWGLTRRAEPHCQDVVRVRCALPLASISSVLVCPTLYGLAVELAAGVVQLPCGVPPDVIAGDPLHRWAVWWWSPPSSTSSSSSVNPPKGTGATARSGQLSNEGSAQDNIHDRPNTNTHKRKSAMKSRALSKKKTTEPQPVTEEIAAVEFGAWVRLLHQCLAVWGLPEPHCVDEEMFCYLIHEEEEED